MDLEDSMGYINIEERIYNIRKRPKMYVHEVRLDYIYYLIAGSLGSNIGSRDVQNIDIAFKRDFNQWVEEWIYEKKEIDFRRKVVVWHKIISSCANGDEEAVNLFYQISSEFFEVYHKENG